MKLKSNGKGKKMAKITRILFHPEILNTYFQTVQSNRTLKKIVYDDTANRIHNFAKVICKFDISKLIFIFSG